MNLKEQRYIYTLAKTGSLSLAASQLYISQPALSLYVKGLEESLGYKLFERIGKRFVLTRAGELYAEKAQLMLDLKQSFDIEIASIIKENRDRIRVGFQDIRSSDIVPVLTKEFYNAFQNVDLIWYEETYGQMEERLKNDQIDIFFGNCPYTKREYEYVPIQSDRLLLIASSESQALRNFYDDGQLIPWIDLKVFRGERFVLLNEWQSLRIYSDQILKECGVHPKEVFILKKTKTMMALVGLNFGVGFCPESYLRYTGTNENIRAFRVGQSTRAINFSAVYKRGKQLSGGMKMLIDTTREIAGS